MLAIFCDTPGQLTAKDLPKPVRGEGEVLVRIRRIGVCGTDLHIFTGNQPYLSYPRIMGHELSGTVEEAPDGSPLPLATWSPSFPISPAENAAPA